MVRKKKQLVINTHSVYIPSTASNDTLRDDTQLESEEEPAVEPVVAEPVVEVEVKPVVVEPVVEAEVKPVVVEPVVEVEVKPTAVEPVVAEPVVEVEVKPTAVEPVVAEPVVEAEVKPVVEPVVAEPVVEAEVKPVVEPVVEAEVKQKVEVKPVVEPVVEVEVEQEVEVKPVVEPVVEVEVKQEVVEVEPVVVEVEVEPVVEAEVKQEVVEVEPVQSIEYSKRNNIDYTKNILNGYYCNVIASETVNKYMCVERLIIDGNLRVRHTDTSCRNLFLGIAQNSASPGEVVNVLINGISIINVRKNVNLPVLNRNNGQIITTRDKYGKVNTQSVSIPVNKTDLLVLAGTNSDILSGPLTHYYQYNQLGNEGLLIPYKSIQLNSNNLSYTINYTEQNNILGQKIVGGNKFIQVLDINIENGEMIGYLC